MNLHIKYRTILNNANINTPLRLAHFFAQIDHESGLKPTSENTNYSRKTLLTIFRKYFNESNVDEYYRNGEKILNRTYGNRMGNGPESSGDGYKYRGRGFIQVTGKNNYRKLSEFVGVDYVSNPDLLLTEADSMVSALWYWTVNNLNKYADQDNLDAVSDLINIGRLTKTVGDANGYADRKRKLEKYKKVFNVK